MDAEENRSCSEIEAGIEVHHGDGGDDITDSNKSDDLQNVTTDETISFESDDEERAGEPLGRSRLAGLFKALLCVFPKVEPLPWGTFAVLTLWSAIPATGFILLFTQMGFGENIYYVTAEKIGEYACGLMLCLSAFVFVLYMLDADEWTSKFGKIFLNFGIFVILSGVVLLVLLIADRFPYGMICLFAVMYPLWLLALKLMCYGKKDTRTFVSWLSGPLFFLSVAVVVAWIAWVFSDPDNEWNIVARMVAAERTGCAPDYNNHPECMKKVGSEETCFHVEKRDGEEKLVFPEGCDQSCTNVYNDCSNGFILWMGPLLVHMTTIFLSFFCTFLRTQRSRKKDVLNFGAIWIFLLLAIWVTTSFAGTAADVTAALAALTLASFVASAMLLAVSFNKEEQRKSLAAMLERLREKYGKRLDYARSLFVVTCAPIILIYLGLSVINQFIRRSGLFPCSQPPGDEGDIFTTRTRKQVDRMKSWNRTKVLMYAVYWGIGFIIMQVLVAKLTVVFLSWMIEETANFGIVAVTGIMIAVSVIMFLLPPVPGVPIYLTLGIVLPAQGYKSFGWTGSIAYSMAIGLILKLFASALQQKLIGETLSRNVKVRQFVNINSKMMKSMRLVLEKDGLSVPKVAILIGGPDWPTSVLCGIMNLSLPQILLGTLPIVFLVSPTCLTGALLYMASIKTDSGNPEFPWAHTASAITTLLTTVVNIGSMLVALYHLERTAGKRASDLEAIPDDEEVKEADNKASHLHECYDNVMKWNVLPLSTKILIQIALVCIVTACYMVQLFSSLSFTPHALTDSLDKNLGGKVSGLFLPLGWLAVGLSCVSTILIYFIQNWGQREAIKQANWIVALGSQVDPSPDNSSAAETAEPHLGGSYLLRDDERTHLSDGLVPLLRSEFGDTEKKATL